MKKLISLMLCLVLAASMAIPAIAAGNQTELTLTIPADLETYELTIPATVEIDLTSKFAAIPVKLSNVNLVWTNALYVYVTSENKGYLVNTENPELKMQYRLTDWAGTEYTDFDKVFTGTSSHEEYRDGHIEIDVLDEYPGAGTYTDILTFSVEIN